MEKLDRIRRDSLANMRQERQNGRHPAPANCCLQTIQLDARLQLNPQNLSLITDQARR